MPHTQIINFCNASGFFGPFLDYNTVMGARMDCSGTIMWNLDLTNHKKEKMHTQDAGRNKRKLDGVDIDKIPTAQEAAKRTKLAVEQEKAERDAAQRAREDVMCKKSEDQVRDILSAFPEALKSAAADGKSHWDVDIVDYFAVDAQLIANLLRLHLSNRRHDYIVDLQSRYDNKKNHHESFIAISWYAISLTVTSWCVSVLVC